jgi:hypothetical protein
MKAGRQRRTDVAARGARRRRGTALVELAMCIPLLAGVIALTAFLGWAMMNQQNVKAAARYTSWRRVYGGWPQRNPDDPNDVDDPNHPGLNVLFFRERASSVHVEGGSGQTDEFEQLIAAAGNHSDYAATFADWLILHPPPDRGHFQHARRAHVWASFRSDLEMLNRYRGAIHSRHIRDGVEWRRGQADCRHVTREQFLGTLDEVLLDVPAPGDGMARMVRSLYLHGW